MVFFLSFFPFLGLSRKARQVECHYSISWVFEVYTALLQQCLHRWWKTRCHKPVISLRSLSSVSHYFGAPWNCIYCFCTLSAHLWLIHSLLRNICYHFFTIFLFLFHDQLFRLFSTKRWKTSSLGVRDWLLSSCCRNWWWSGSWFWQKVEKKVWLLIINLVVYLFITSSIIILYSIC